MQTVDVGRMEELQDQDETVVIDVLPEESFDNRHIPGAINIPVAAPDFEERVEDAVPERSTPVVVYCADEECQASPRAARHLEEMGYERVYEFSGGLKAWRKAGHELTGQPKRVLADD